MSGLGHTVRDSWRARLQHWLKPINGPTQSDGKSCTSFTDPVIFFIFWKRWKQGGYRSCLWCFNISEGSSPSPSEVMNLLFQSHSTLLAPSKFLPSMLQIKCDHTDTLKRMRQFSQEQTSQYYCACHLGLSARPRSSTFLLFLLAALLLYHFLLSSCATNHTVLLSTLSSFSAWYASKSLTYFQAQR